MSEVYAFARKRDVPNAAETPPKVCTRCGMWFGAQARERTCTGCLSPSERAKRASGYRGTNPAVKPQSSQVSKGAKRSPGRSVLLDDLRAIARLHGRAAKDGLQEHCQPGCLWCKAATAGVR